MATADKDTVRLGTREVSLIGGEAYLRRDWVEIVRAVRSRGMYCAIQTGGRHFTQERLDAAESALRACSRCDCPIARCSRPNSGW